MWKDTAFDVFPVLGTRELDTGFQVGSHQNRVEGQNPLPPPAGHASLDAAQDTVGLWGCKHTLPAQVEFLSRQYPSVHFRSAGLSPFVIQNTHNTFYINAQGFVAGKKKQFMLSTHLLQFSWNVSSHGIYSALRDSRTHHFDIFLFTE